MEGINDSPTYEMALLSHQEALQEATVGLSDTSLGLGQTNQQEALLGLPVILDVLR